MRTREGQRDLELLREWKHQLKYQCATYSIFSLDFSATKLFARPLRNLTRKYLRGRGVFAAHLRSRALKYPAEKPAAERPLDASGRKCLHYPSAWQFLASTGRSAQGFSAGYLNARLRKCAAKTPRPLKYLHFAFSVGKQNSKCARLYSVKPGRVCSSLRVGNLWTCGLTRRREGKFKCQPPRWVENTEPAGAGNAGGPYSIFWPRRRNPMPEPNAPVPQAAFC